MKRPGVITGLIREAECLDVFPADQRPTVACSGARSDQAALLAREMIVGGCQGLVSFGTAGGLTAALGPGAVVIAESVAAPDGRVFEISATWRGRALESLGDDTGVTVAVVAGADGVIATTDAKRALAEETSAVAVDMESHAAAAVAAEAGMPFLVVRVIADPLERPIPAWLPGRLTADGAPDYGAVIAGLARRPWDMPVLIGLARDNARALARLRRVASLLGPLFRLA